MEERSRIEHTSDPLLLEVAGLRAEREGTEILRGLDLAVRPGELHAVAGPQGSGKSAFAGVLLGHPAYPVTSGRLRFKGEDLTDLPTDVRAKAGIFLAFQHPEEVPGVPVTELLLQAVAARRGAAVSAIELRARLGEWLDRLGLPPSLAEHHLDPDLPEGQRRQAELLHLALLEPELAILDGIGAGPDYSGLADIAGPLGAVRASRPRLGAILLTGDPRLPATLAPDRVHVLVEGRIVESGGPELAEQLEREGFPPWRS